MSSAFVNIVMLVAAAIVYGGVFSANKLAAAAGWPPLMFAFAQSLLAGGVLAAVALGRGEALVPTRRHAAVYLVIGALFIGLPIALLTTVAPHLPAATTTLVLALAPVLTLLLAIAARIERFRWAALAGVACGLAGILVLVLDGSALGGAPGWFLLALAAPVMFALGNVGSSKLWPPATASLTMAAGVLIGSAVILTPLILITGTFAGPTAGIGPASVPVLIAAAINAAFFVLLFEIIRRAGPTFFSQFNYLAVLAGVAWGAVLFGERPGPMFWVALALMLAGVFLATRAPASVKPAAA